MSNLTATPGDDSIYQLELTDPVRGGAGGVANRQAQQLLNKLEFIRGVAKTAIRASEVNPVGIYNITQADFGKLLSVLNPAAAALNLPPLSSVTKGNPLSIVINTINTGDVVYLTASGSEVIEDVMNNGNGQIVYPLVQGTRITLVATETSWVVVLKTTPRDPVYGFQPGDIVTTANPSLTRTGFLLCNGQLVSRTTYAALFAAIGTSYHAGDGVNTFGVPPATDRFFRSWNGNTSGLDVGRVFGSTQADMIKDHTHNTTFETRDLDNVANTVGPDLTSDGSGVAGSPDFTRTTTATTGHPETRPVNVSVNTFIKY
jgi:microcystin-dependent protein